MYQFSFGWHDEQQYLIITVTVIKQPHYEVKIRHNPEYQDKVREPHKAEHIKLVIRFRVPSKTKQWYQIRAILMYNSYSQNKPPRLDNPYMLCFAVLAYCQQWWRCQGFVVIKVSYGDEMSGIVTGSAKSCLSFFIVFWLQSALISYRELKNFLLHVLLHFISQNFTAKG